MCEQGARRWKLGEVEGGMSHRGKKSVAAEVVKNEGTRKP